MISINVGTFVKTKEGRVGRVLHLAEYKQVADKNGERTEATAAMVQFANRWAGLYPLSDLIVIGEDEYNRAAGGNGHEPEEQTPAAKPLENVWRWCPVCWDRTDHKPMAYLMLQCTVCGNRIPANVPDMARAYAVPVDETKPIPVVTESNR